MRAILRSRNFIARALLVALLASLSLLTAACKQDNPNNAQIELYTFLAACPEGPFVCYENCLTQNDANGSGTIEGSETFNFNICSQTCQSKCSLAFLFYYLNNED